MPDLVETPTFRTRGLKQEELFPIREVARLTGVNPVTLRAWERRYGLIQPVRTDSGHRLYSFKDVETVRSAMAWIERGVPISKVGAILTRQMVSDSNVVQRHAPVSAGEWGQWRGRLLAASQGLDEAELERVYGQTFSSYPLAVVFQEIIMPVWRSLLLRHERPDCGSEWLFLDTFLRTRLLQRLHNLREQSGRRVLLLALPGRCRELELLVAGLLLNPLDNPVQVLGIGQRLEALPQVCERIRPEVVVVFSNQAPAEQTSLQLESLALALSCPLALAGEGADLLEDSLRGSPVACLGSEAGMMQRRLRQFLEGRLDT